MKLEILKNFLKTKKKRGSINILAHVLQTFLLSINLGVKFLDGSIGLYVTKLFLKVVPLYTPTC